MTPAASVSGLYFAHPQARYFSVGRIGEDQIASYARRKALSTEAVERWLAPSLGYEPAAMLGCPPENRQLRRAATEDIERLETDIEVTESVFRVL